jgi:hypothetical protein
MVGACVSTIVIVCDLVAELLPQPSTATHVRVIVCAHAVPPVTSAPTVFTVAPLQASLAVGAVNDGEAVHSIVTGPPAAPMVGACESTIVIVCDLVAELLLQASTAIHVLVTVLAHAVPPVTSAPTIFTVLALHASDAVGAVNDGVPVHSTVPFAPALPMVGACVSTIVIVCDLVTDVLPQASTAFHVRVTVLAQDEPPVTSAPTIFTVAPLQASLAVGAVKIGEAVHSIVALAPAVLITGACVSTIVNVCDLVAEVLPHASTAFHVRVTVLAQAVPPVISTPTIFTVAPPQASLAVGTVKFGDAVHSIVAEPPAAPMVGACVSTMVIVCDLVTELLPHASVAFHVRVIVCAHAVPPVTSAPTIFTVAPLQASLAVGAVNDGVPVHSTVPFAPALPMVGACVSTIVIVCDLVAELLPQPSTATHVRVTVCAHAVPPVTSAPTVFTVAPLHASLAVGALNDGVPVHSTVPFAPALPMVGACVSTIVIVCDLVAELLPQPSTATHVRVIICAHAVPPVTSAPTVFTVAPLQASLAVGAVNDGVPVHSTVAGPPAAPMVGACVSTMVMV